MAELTLLARDTAGGTGDRGLRSAGQMRTNTALALFVAVAIIFTARAEFMSLQMVIDSRDQTEAWRPFVYEAIQAALLDMDGAISAKEVFEHRTQTHANVAYAADILFGQSPDGPSAAFNASTKLYEHQVYWGPVSNAMGDALPFL